MVLLPSMPAVAGIEGRSTIWPPPVQPLQLKGPKGSALGGDPRGGAPWWGFRGKAPDLRFPHPIIPGNSRYSFGGERRRNASRLTTCGASTGVSGLASVASVVALAGAGTSATGASAGVSGRMT